jgi:hypothetical protein
MKIPNSLRLSLRELFLLILIAAMGLGWYREYRFAAPMHQALAEMRNRSPAYPVGISHALHSDVVFQVFALGKGFRENNTIELTILPITTSADAPAPRPEAK